MNPVYIEGVGIISQCAVTSDGLTSLSLDKAAAKEGKVEYTSVIPSSKLRRCSRYIRLAAEAAVRASEDGCISDDIDRYKIGAVLSSGFGAVESNIQFADSVVKNNPALCSPAVFSGTVPNSCLGQICIIGGYKGAGTMLMSGDPMEYSAILLNTEKADYILCGSVEEYSEELAKSIHMRDASKGLCISEAAAVLAVSVRKTERTYCRVVNFSSAPFSDCPYIHKISSKEAENVISTAFNSIPHCEYDAVFSSENGTYLDSTERKVLKEICPSSKIIAPKKWFGETFGSGYLLNVSYAAALIKKGDVRSALVTGIDTAGNYLCCVLEEVR